MADGLKTTQITWHRGAVTPADRQQVLKQRGCTLWFTGLSGSGKSTLAVALEQVLLQRGHAAYVLDGDNVRFGLNAAPKTLRDGYQYSEAQANRFGLTFAMEDRAENIRRIGEVAKLFADAGLLTLTSFISPYRNDRAAVRTIHAKHPAGALPFFEVYVATPLAICEQRDPKGLYKQARAALAGGQRMNFTGIDDPYEPPENPELTVDMGTQTVDEGLAQILSFLAQQGIFS